MLQNTEFKKKNFEYDIKGISNTRKNRQIGFHEFFKNFFVFRGYYQSEKVTHRIRKHIFIYLRRD